MAWIDAKVRVPNTGKIVLCKVAHYQGVRVEEHKMKKVDESDCDWRTADDNSELNFDWHVSHWWEE